MRMPVKWGDFALAGTGRVWDHEGAETALDFSHLPGALCPAEPHKPLAGPGQG